MSGMLLDCLRLLLATAVSAVFFRLYAKHDALEIWKRLQMQAQAAAVGGDKALEDLDHTGRHAVRLATVALLALLVTPWGLSLVPAFMVIGGVGWLLFDPSLNHDRGLSWDYTGEGNNWDKFLRWLTGRDNQAGKWSAVIEGFLVLCGLAWYLILAWMRHA